MPYLSSKSCGVFHAIDYGSHGNGSRKQRQNVSPSRLFAMLQRASILNKRHGVCMPCNVLAFLIQDCANSLNFTLGRELEHIIVNNGFESSSYLGSFSVRMYASCSCLVDANWVFGRMLQPDKYAWSAIISAHANLGQAQQAVGLFYQMHTANATPDSHVLVAALKASSCTNSLTCAELIQHHIIESDVKFDEFVWSALTELYVKHGDLGCARHVFSMLQKPDVVTWDILLSGYVEQGCNQEAILMHDKMLRDSVEPDRVSFLCILRACSSMPFLQHAMIVHHHIIDFGAEGDTSLVNTLINTYAKCGSCADAKEVFRNLPRRDIVTWGAMIEGCVQSGQGHDALEFSDQMLHKDLKLDKVALLSILKACSMLAALNFGRLIHGCILETAISVDSLIGSSLIDMYAKSGVLDDASKVFQSIPNPNVVTWNAVITGYVQHGCGTEALHLFHQMMKQGKEANQVTLVCMSKICSVCLELDIGKLIHSVTIENGYETSISITNTLIDMYARCACLSDARKLFEKMPKSDTVSWSVLISGYVQHNDLINAFQILAQMLQVGLQPDEALFISILKACCNTATSLIRIVHAQLIENGIESDVSLGNALVDAYGKCKTFEDTWSVFESLPMRDLVTYNSVMSACIDFDQVQKSFWIFEQMLQDRIEPSGITYISILGACACTGCLDEGKIMHCMIIERDMDCNNFVVNSLIDMYGKCGSLESARRVLDRWPKQDIVSWNAFIAGCAQHGNWRLALDYYNIMQLVGIIPDHVTFVSLLAVCSHAGLVEEGNNLFQAMKSKFGIPPTIDHYNCMVDLLGRVGRVKEALDFLGSTPFEDNIVGWTSILSHCNLSGNLNLGKMCFDQFVEVDDSNAAAYTLMSHSYSNVGLQADACVVESMRKDNLAWKKPGRALLQIGIEVHGFIGGSWKSSTGDIGVEMTRLSNILKMEGYVPSLSLVIQMTFENEKSYFNM